MTDLAPFVVATIRDKAVSDWQEENARLQSQLKAYRKIQVVSGNGDDFDEDEDELVVYAEGQLEDGYFRNADRLFEVKLENKNRSLLEDLGNVGGFHKFKRTT